MEKTILIPIDFKVESLNTLKLAIQENSSQKIHAVLLYTGTLTNSITELLFYSQREIIKSLLTAEFEQALSIIKNRYETILQSVSIQLLHGNNQSSMNRFLHANAVDEIFIPQTYQLHTGSNGFDPLPLLRSSLLPVHNVNWKHSINLTGANQLDALFNTHQN